MITRRLLIKNSTLNFIGQLLPLLITIFTIPYVIRGLGAERFAIFAILKVLIDYFGVFDLGLSGATTKFVAEAIVKDEHDRVVGIFWTSLVFVFFGGLIGMSVFYLIVPPISGYFLNVNPNLIDEMITVFRISSTLIFAILIKLFLNGVLEAHQRFDLITLIRTPSTIVSALIPVVAIYFGYGLITIISWMVVGELITLLGYYLLSVNIIPKGKLRLLELKSFKPILFFGGWLCSIKMLAWIMANIQSLLIGSLITMTAVTYYQVPYLLTSRMAIIGASIMPVIYSAYSSLHTIDKEKSEKLCIYSVKYAIALYGLPTLILIVFANEILILWLGNDFQQSITVLQILAVGGFFTAITWVLGTFIQIGKPKLISTIGFLQVPIDIFITWLLIKNFGITGAALAWSLMRGLTIMIFYITCKRLNIFNLSLEVNSKFVSVISGIILILGINFTLKSFLSLSIASAVINISVLIFGYIFIIWQYFMDERQKDDIINKIKQISHIF